ncbi:MAG: DUF86 domain-containing protein [Anaerolineales bacterium]|nr:DUF86 domain-containing protein [Anaerolineales bacterium]
MRTEALYLDDILDAADAIARFLRDIEKETFLSDDLYQSAVLQKLTVIGEAASRLSEDFRNRHSEIRWRGIIGLRNVAVHRYFGINWDNIWHTATQEVPLLREQIAAILAAEFSDDEGSTKMG